MFFCFYKKLCTIISTYDTYALASPHCPLRYRYVWRGFPRFHTEKIYQELPVYQPQRTSSSSYEFICVILYSRVWYNTDGLISIGLDVPYQGHEMYSSSCFSLWKKTYLTWIDNTNSYKLVNFIQIFSLLWTTLT
jgi:hypothetical protein